VFVETCSGGGVISGVAAGGASAGGGVAVSWEFVCSGGADEVAAGCSGGVIGGVAVFVETCSDGGVTSGVAGGVAAGCSSTGGGFVIEFSTGGATAGGGVAVSWEFVCSCGADEVAAGCSGGVTGGVVSGGAVFVEACAGCPSSSFILSINAARAAACAGVSAARMDMKLAQKVMAQTAESSFEILITVFYANFSPDATAFPPG
jgi:hypothetical protein